MPSPEAPSSSIEDCLRRDQHRLRRERDRLRGDRLRGNDVAAAEAALAGEDRRVRRGPRRPCGQRARIAYPEELPVSANRDEIRRAIEQHPVVIVCGETGSGKTTQLPKICLEAGRGVAGIIGHTQPRRIAARAVAARIAEELTAPLGPAGRLQAALPGSQPPGRPDQADDRRHPAGRDAGRPLPRRLRHDHRRRGPRAIAEHRLPAGLPEVAAAAPAGSQDHHHLGDHRPAALLEAFRRCADHQRLGPQLSGRGALSTGRARRGRRRNRRGRAGRHPARPSTSCWREQPGDILVFLSGEREIRETAESLRKHHPQGCEILPLYSRLSQDEQQRVFRPSGRRRIVLATNVAETSLTVPGIRAVIDTGVARISRYSHRSRLQRLPIEKISQASANQRSGRCGRVGPGIAIRLYSEEDFLARPEFTEPEIQRTNLAAVILQMHALKLGDIEAFPVRRAARRALCARRPAHAARAECAVDERQADRDRPAPVPAAAGSRASGACCWPARTNTASRRWRSSPRRCPCPIPRDRPADKQTQADQKHAPLRDEQSDFLSLLKLWRAFVEQREHLSRARLRGMVQGEFPFLPAPHRMAGRARAGDGGGARASSR